MEWSRYWTVGLVILGAVGALGCEPGETVGEPTCPDDPAYGLVPEKCGIWVSAGKGDDTNDGTQAAPVATLMHAIELAEKGPGRVYACGETWEEVVMVPSGVSLHGGFDCEAGWAYAGAAARGKLVSTGPTAITWFAGESQKGAFFTDFYVKSADAVEPSGSSIALFIRDWLPLAVLRAELVAGNGADGLDGEPADDSVPAANGAPGNDGADACSAPVSKGGIPAETACAAGTSKGGKGGDSGPMLAEMGDRGEPESSLDGGEGGLGEAMSPNCTAGSPGLDAFENASGYGGSKFGRLTKEGFVGTPGEDGKVGPPGQGGGGGGALFGSVAVCGAVNPGGAAGGSGGGGGCGGKPGKGGQPGGSSIAFATRGDGAVRTDYVVFRSGNGGNGGNGGAGQPGGWGGPGGKGGKGAGGIPDGCPGGHGGRGGQGGQGGGGAGGHSVTTMSLNDTTGFARDHFEHHIGNPGQGGKGDPYFPIATDGDSGVYSSDLGVDP